VQGFALTWNSQTNTSKRTVAMANAMASVKDKNHQQHSNQRKKVHWTKKHDKIAGLPQTSTNVHKSMVPSVAKEWPSDHPLPTWGLMFTHPIRA
jgi:hypothetical protein